MLTAEFFLYKCRLYRWAMVHYLIILLSYNEYRIREDNKFLFLFSKLKLNYYQSQFKYKQHKGPF